MELTPYSVLGINGRNGAHRLAKVLLADPLVEEQAWEKQLVDSAEEDGRALLIRSVCRCLWEAPSHSVLGTMKTTAMTGDIPCFELFPFPLLSSTIIR